MDVFIGNLSELQLQLLDKFFILFHTALILFNLTGWYFRKTRKIHLFVQCLIIGSWVILGYWYGWGYCVCTDWHWSVLYKLGHFDMPYSYIKFLIDTYFGTDLNAEMVDTVTLWTFVGVVGLSVIGNIRDYLQKRRARRPRGN